MLKILLRSTLRLAAAGPCKPQQVRNIINISSLFAATNGHKYIATHDGMFHCDEVTACFMLKQLDTFKDYDIVRTRDRKILDSADIVVDVGGIFDGASRRFDHHQRSFQLTIRDFHPDVRSTNPNKPIRLSSAGLIYAHYGKDFIREVLRKTSNDRANKTSGCHANMNLDKNMLDAIFEQYYNSFMEEIDAIDNGVEMVEGEDFVYNYNLSTHLAARVRRLNPQEASTDDRLKQFHQAMSVVGLEMIECLKQLATSWWPSLESMKKSVLDRFSLDESGAIVHISSDTIWRTTIFKVEEQLSIAGQIKYVILNNPHDKTRWRIIAVPVSPKSTSSRLALKEDWRGLHDDELRKKSGISDAVFVHASGFIGGATSKEGCIALAKKTIDFSLKF